jgi:hypothetical protein
MSAYIAAADTGGELVPLRPRSVVTQEIEADGVAGRALFPCRAFVRHEFVVRRCGAAIQSVN